MAEYIKKILSEDYISLNLQVFLRMTVLVSIILCSRKMISLSLVLFQSMSIINVLIIIIPLYVFILFLEYKIFLNLSYFSFIITGIFISYIPLKIFTFLLLLIFFTFEYRTFYTLIRSCFFVERSKRKKIYRKLWFIQMGNPSDDNFERLQDELDDLFFIFIENNYEIKKLPHEMKKEYYILKRWDIIDIYSDDKEFYIYLKNDIYEYMLEKKI